jgi:NAD+ kinase
MALVALGTADGFLMQSENYKHSIRIVDIAASSLILREAGGEVYDLNGNIFNMPPNLEYRANFLAVSSKDVFDFVMKGESSRDVKSDVRFGLYANMNIPDIDRIAKEVISQLGDSEYYVDTALAERLGCEGMPLRDMDVDIVIVMGGDGTLLRATHNTDAKIEAMSELLDGALPGENWLGYQKLWESNVRRTTPVKP